MRERERERGREGGTKEVVYRGWHRDSREREREREREGGYYRGGIQGMA